MGHATRDQAEYHRDALLFILTRNSAPSFMPGEATTLATKAIFPVPVRPLAVSNTTQWRCSMRLPTQTGDSRS